MKTLVDLEFSIIEGDTMRFLENYLDTRIFEQRKSFDEYYVMSNQVEMELDLGILMILSEGVHVEVYNDSITLRSKEWY